MRTTGYISGYISASDAFTLLQAGLTLYIVSAPLDTNALPLDGAWRDENGVEHSDCSAIVLNPNTAQEIGRAYRQQYIMRLTPDISGNSEIYLLKDSEFARQVALKYCGGYTADGSYLLTAVAKDTDPFEDSYVDWISVDVEYIPVKR